ncbi:nucleotidyltransferase domain-containing protein [uncultured Cellulomonas sp.]|uniref:nucleotidyltransferase domain-containing protein n=1 Tax=uncultured Cellulomonas sp. TaxID=189682 RepID=UPI0026019367|nr:nucleotidyltransferase domain-containing protein [uncultured Cellulomonas sp.]
MPEPSADRHAEVHRLLTDVTGWARSRPDVDAVALVGSYARDAARTTSDVDVVVLGPGTAGLADDLTWFGLLRPGSELVRAQAWGPLLERRFRLPSGLVVELGLAPSTWADVPLDAGTRRVLRDGHRVLHDPHGLLRRAGDAAMQ